MSDPIIQKVIPKTSVKENCDICNKEIGKSFMRKHKEKQHNVAFVTKKKEDNSKKKEDVLKKKEDISQEKEGTSMDESMKEINVEKEENWSKVWISEPVPKMSTLEVEEQLDEIEEPLITLSTKELNDYMRKSSDSILEEV